MRGRETEERISEGAWKAKYRQLSKKMPSQREAICDWDKPCVWDTCNSPALRTGLASPWDKGRLLTLFRSEACGLPDEAMETKDLES
jgi:hypothetical protein